MSTAGKVLTVVVALAILGWLVMMSMVASLDRNWGQELDKLTAQIGTLEQDIATTRKQINDTLDQIQLQQESEDNELTALRADLSKLGKFESQEAQALRDVELHIQIVQDASKDAELARQKREAETLQTAKDLEALRQEVETRKMAVNDLIGQLQKLQESFVATLKDNQQLLRQLRGSSAAMPRTRPATFLR